MASVYRARQAHSMPGGSLAGGSATTGGAMETLQRNRKPIDWDLIARLRQETAAEEAANEVAREEEACQRKVRSNGSHLVFRQLPNGAYEYLGTRRAEKGYCLTVSINGAKVFRGAQSARQALVVQPGEGWMIESAKVIRSLIEIKLEESPRSGLPAIADVAPCRQGGESDVFVLSISPIGLV